MLVREVRIGLSISLTASPLDSACNLQDCLEIGALSYPYSEPAYLPSQREQTRLSSFYLALLVDACASHAGLQHRLEVIALATHFDLTGALAVQLLQIKLRLCAVAR